MLSDASVTHERRSLTSDQDLTALIRPEPVDQTGIYTHALQLLSSLQGSPSCNRLAAYTLIESCQIVDDSTQNAEDSLEDMRSVYAAQLAMCEIVSAGSAVPQACKSLDVSPGVKIHQTSGFKQIRRDQLGLCLQSLESKPQWWTSYSNSRQNAMVMCQAARADIEKGKRPHIGFWLPLTWLQMSSLSCTSQQWIPVQMPTPPCRELLKSPMKRSISL